MQLKWLFVVVALSVLAALAIIGGSVMARGPVPQSGNNPQPTATPTVVTDHPNSRELALQSPTGGGGSGPVSPSFSYQGQLKSGNTPVNGNCDFVFSLWDQSGTGQPPSGGSQYGTTLTQTNVLVTNGLFDTTLNFGNVFTGDARWLQIAVRCPAGSGQTYTILSPRQPLWATPYALGLRPGAWVEGNQNDWNAIYASNVATTNLSYGIRALSDSPLGRGVSGESGATGGMGVYGFSVSSGGAGVAGYIGSNTIDVDTFGTQQYGVFGKSASNAGVGVMGLSGPALVTETHPIGLYYEGGGEFVGSNGMIGATSLAGSPGGYGIFGVANKSSDRAIVGLKVGGGDYAGYFNGNVNVVGNLSASGTKPFKIDNPLDPANQYLYHYAVEAPQVQNVYNGTITLDAKGEAIVTLPAYFSAINTGDYRYYLTAIGAPMPDLYIAEEIQGNTFKIAGGAAGKKVSWMVYGLRNDPWLRDNPQQDVVAKPSTEAGTYVYPQGYGQPESVGLSYQQLQPQATVTPTMPGYTPQVPPSTGSNSNSGTSVQP